MFHLGERVGRERNRPFEFLFFRILPLVGILVARVVARREPAVDFAEILRFIEESLEVEAGVGIPCRLVLDAVAHIELVDSRALVPAVGGVVGYVSAEIVEERYA